MSLKIPLHPLNEISPEFLHDFARQVVARRAVGIQELEGKALEQIVCNIYGVPWKGSNAGLPDVMIESTGMSCKGLQHNVKGDLAKTEDGKPRRIRTVIGRNSPDTHSGGHVQKNVTPPNEAGEIITGIWSDRLTKTYELCREFRQLTILKSKDLSRWLLFEFVPQPFYPDRFVWRWDSKSKTTNLYGESLDSNISLTWQPNGSQFTLTQDIPEKNFQFELPAVVPLISEQEILDRIGFRYDWIKT